MKNHFIQLFFKHLVGIFCILLLTGCDHTIQGMKQDVREMGDSDDQKVTVIKKTTVVRYQSSPSPSSPSSLPSSPPPLQTPPQ